MVRDMELIRILLKEIEGGNLNPRPDGFDEAAVLYHLHLLEERGLLEALVKFSNSGREPRDVPALVVVKRLTWDGHDFIQAIADDTKWSKVKAFLKEGGKDLTVETIKMAAGQLFGFGDS